MWLITNYIFVKGFTKLTDEQIRIINKSYIRNLRQSQRKNKAGEYAYSPEVENEEMNALYLSRFGKEIKQLRLRREWLTKNDVVLPEYMNLFK